MDEEAHAPAYAHRPDTLRNLRACTSCCLIKSLNQFVESFCDNCWADWASGQLPSSLNRGECLDIAQERTTADFEGVVSMMRPSASWVARWLRMRASGGAGRGGGGGGAAGAQRPESRRSARFRSFPSPSPRRTPSPSTQTR